MLKDTLLSSEMTNTVIPAIRAASKLRNTLMHANWGVSSSYPDELICNPIFGHNLVYRATDFEEAIERISAASKAVREFGQQLMKSREK